jgi:hypothetical protein
MTAPSVDWRSRFGRNWITSVRNQANAPNCWAFAATALVEAMVRIEHCLWSSRSEGDMVRDQGFGKVSYQANLLEPAGFYGLRGTNPDPWCRRRMRNGALIQGGNGGKLNNFELFVRRGSNIEHWFRDNAAAGFPWHLVANVRSADPWRDTFHDDALDGAAAVESTFNRNYELIYRSSYGQMRRAVILGEHRTSPRKALCTVARAHRSYRRDRRSRHVVFDDRGRFTEPHTGRSVALGTVMATVGEGGGDDNENRRRTPYAA